MLLSQSLAVPQTSTASLPEGTEPAAAAAAAPKDVDGLIGVECKTQFKATDADALNNVNRTSWSDRQQAAAAPRDIYGLIGVEC
eukprot:1156927-Pelagomonas_calceolata.AAC.10